MSGAVDYTISGVMVGAVPGTDLYRVEWPGGRRSTLNAEQLGRYGLPVPPEPVTVTVTLHPDELQAWCGSWTEWYAHTAATTPWQRAALKLARAARDALEAPRPGDRLVDRNGAVWRVEGDGRVRLVRYSSGDVPRLGQNIASHAMGKVERARGPLKREGS